MLDVFKIPKLNHLSTKNKTGLSLYPWKNCQPDSSHQLQKPLAECNLAIVSSTGLPIPQLNALVKEGYI